MSTSRTALRGSPRIERPRRSRSRKPRSRSIPVAMAAAVAGVVLLGAGVFLYLSQGEGAKPKPKAVHKPILASVQLTLAGVNNVNGGPSVQLPDDARNQILRALGAYVDQGLVEPMKTGKPAADLSSLFDAGAAARIKGPDNDVLFESGQPARTGAFKPAAQPVFITALSDGSGQFVLATATVMFAADVDVKGGTLQTTRSIALTFIPDNGQWKVTGYDVTVARRGAGIDVPTTTSAVKQP